jgi:hypothetical protein
MPQKLRSPAPLAGGNRAGRVPKADAPEHTPQTIFDQAPPDLDPAKYPLIALHIFGIVAPFVTISNSRPRARPAKRRPRLRVVAGGAP